MQKKRLVNLYPPSMSRCKQLSTVQYSTDSEQLRLSFDVTFTTPHNIKLLLQKPSEVTIEVARSLSTPWYTNYAVVWWRPETSPRFSWEALIWMEHFQSVYECRCKNKVDGQSMLKDYLVAVLRSLLVASFPKVSEYIDFVLSKTS